MDEPQGDYRIERMPFSGVETVIDWAAAEGWNPGLGDAACFYAIDPNGFFMGAGLMHHMGPTIHGDGFFEDVEFDDASGVNVELGWRWISVHYVNMSYTGDSSLFDDTVDASHVGIRFTWRFGQPWTNR